MALQGYVTLSSEAIAQEVSGESVILDLRSEQYFSLDEVGTRIWNLLGDHPNLADAYELLLQEYEVDPDQLETDLEALINALLSAGLITVSDQRE